MDAEKNAGMLGAAAFSLIKKGFDSDEVGRILQRSAAAAVAFGDQLEEINRAIERQYTDDNSQHCVCCGHQLSQIARVVSNELGWFLPPRPLNLDSMILRTELINQLAERGVRITHRRINYYQRLGIMPYPIRQWSAGAVRAKYPAWTVDLLEAINELKKNKVKFNEMRPILRERFRNGLAGIPTECPN